jgi:DNA invertase Pin-like site-specific DNA recombinase
MQMHKQEIKNVAELVRVSTDAQAKDGGGIEGQRAACASVVKAHGLTSRWKVDIEGVSGAVVRFTSQMAELEQILKSGECHGVVMKEVSRFLRADDLGDMALAGMLQHHGAVVYTQSSRYDLSKPDDRTMFLFQLGIAGLERSNIMSRCMGTRRTLRSRGKCVSSTDSRNNTLPFALTYNWETEHWAFDKAKGSQVVRLYELFTSGVTSWQELARKTGISRYIIRDILKNPVYSTGVRVFDEMRQDTGRISFLDGKPRKVTRKVKMAEAERVDLTQHGLVPIVPESVAAQAVKLLGLKDEQNMRRNNESEDPFLFRGFLKCGDCGQRLIVIRHSAGGSTREYYVCRNVHGDRGGFDPQTGKNLWRIKNNTCSCARIRRDRIEPMLADLITNRLSDPDFLCAQIEKLRRAVSRTDNKRTIERLTAEISGLEEKQRRLKVLFVDGDLERDEYQAAKNAMGEQIDAARAALKKVKPDVPQIEPGVFTGMVTAFADFAHLERDQQRAILHTFMPVFAISAKAHGRGAGAKTDIQVKGFYLKLTGDDAQLGQGVGDDDRGGVHRSRRKGNQRETRVFTGNPALVSDEGRLPTARDTDQSVYIPLSA